MIGLSAAGSTGYVHIVAQYAVNVMDTGENRCRESTFSKYHGVVHIREGMFLRKNR